MSSQLVVPGTRLVDRYRLDEHLGDAEGASTWRARDELLDRLVGITVVPVALTRAVAVLQAARGAAALSDARFLRVLDADATPEVVYVVREWVEATNLVDLLADGPLHPAEARELAADVAGGLAAAHAAGLVHLCLGPESILRTPHGQIKVTGLAVEAAVRGVSTVNAAEAEARDTRGAAGVAYAALTARWPGDEPTGLQPAPHDGAELCTPRQVRAGVPHDLDVAVSRGLGLAVGSAPTIDHPAELADLLLAAHVSGRPDDHDGHDAAADDGRRRRDAPPYDEERGSRRSPAAVLAWGAVVLVLVIGIVLAATTAVLTLRNRTGGSDAATSSPPASGTPSPSPTGSKIPVVAITSFDPAPQGNGEENGYAAGRAIDGNLVTTWTTKSYKNPFGRLGIKDGVGLVLDLGDAHHIGSVTVRTAGGATDLEVLTSTAPGATLVDFSLLGDGPVRNVDGPATVIPRSDLSARYVLVWLTALPPAGADYRGQVAEVTVRD